MSRARQPIKARPAVVFRRAPLRYDGALLFQPQQDGIKGALIHREQVTTDLLNAPRDAIAVQWPQYIEGLQHHQGQRALLDIHFLLHAVSFSCALSWLANTRMSQFHWESNRCARRRSLCCRGAPLESALRNGIARADGLESSW